MMNDVEKLILAKNIFFLPFWQQTANVENRK